MDKYVRDTRYQLINILPVGHTRLVQSHEVNLAGRAAFSRRKEHLVVTFAQELESLRFLVHKHSIKMAAFHWTDLYGFVTPAHYLTGPDVCNWSWHFTPLKNKYILISISDNIHIHNNLILTQLLFPSNMIWTLN